MQSLTPTKQSQGQSEARKEKENQNPKSTLENKDAVEDVSMENGNPKEERKLSKKAVNRVWMRRNRNNSLRKRGPSARGAGRNREAGDQVSKQCWLVPFPSANMQDMISKMFDQALKSIFKGASLRS